jgi:putative membrane protein
MSMKHGHEEAALSLMGLGPQLILALPFVCALVIYIWAVFRTNHRYKKWPVYRTIFWTAGIFLAIAAVAGPLAEMAHHYFQAHMLGHLFLGMLAPLLMAIAAPMTLTLEPFPSIRRESLPGC